eukprot:5120747-Pyramimonas_sp.AAC.1
MVLMTPMKMMPWSIVPSVKLASVKSWMMWHLPMTTVGAMMARTAPQRSLFFKRKSLSPELEEA